MELQTCPHCGLHGIPAEHAICPSCRKSLDKPQQTFVSVGLTHNPYQSPVAASPAPTNSSKAKKASPKGSTTEPYSHQMAKFSAYAPFILFLMNSVAETILKDEAGSDTTRGIGLFLAGISFCTIVIAPILGVAGLIGGIQRRSRSTIAFAVVGLLLNTILLAFLVSLLVSANDAR